jgi:hypothetical protein
MMTRTLSIVAETNFSASKPIRELEDVALAAGFKHSDFIESKRSTIARIKSGPLRVRLTKPWSGGHHEIYVAVLPETDDDAIRKAKHELRKNPAEYGGTLIYMRVNTSTVLTFKCGEDNGMKTVAGTDLMAPSVSLHEALQRLRPYVEAARRGLVYNPDNATALEDKPTHQP